ncbi:hypothetical protein [Sneathiella litorea]|uniref:Uncharacterized protein n=1 Tax=Sneathiella litorea TaxID=2606216 RepID=A0A6L8W2D6_9PROT|nr:hypothetical protein [Sneathiella litorea]MZR29068.1 hypothetical protein [Sneathiella litorea]
MDEQAFTEFLKNSIRYNQLERYFVATPGPIEDATSHYDLIPNVDEIRRDLADSGGLKLSHAQRRMLMTLIALWNGGMADDLFQEGLGSLPRVIQSMDRNNRELLGNLILTYPGWD